MLDLGRPKDQAAFYCVVSGSDSPCLSSDRYPASLTVNAGARGRPHKHGRPRSLTKPPRWEAARATAPVKRLWMCRWDGTRAQGPAGEPVCARGKRRASPPVSRAWLGLQYPAPFRRIWARTGQTPPRALDLYCGLRSKLISSTPTRGVQGKGFSLSGSCARRSDDTDAPSRVVSGPVAAGSAFMLPYFVRC
jgi:hypothetical protein